MVISSTIITFRIDIDFEGSDVDMVLKEMTSRGVSSPVPSILCDGAKIKIDKKKLPKTPTEASVDFALNWLQGFVDKQRMCTTSGRSANFQLRDDEKTELEKIGIEVVETYGLMQGCCHLICECDISIFSNELVEKAKDITKKGIIKLKNDIVEFINNNNGDDITLINVANDSDMPPFGVYVDMYCGDNDFDPTTSTFNFEDYTNKIQK